jgi:predicted GNAT family N-acyltransferase
MLEIEQISPIETYKLRLEVLKTCEQYQYKYQGDFDKSTIHFAAFKNNDNIGIVSLMENKNVLLKGKQVQLRGMAVSKIQQSKGVGKLLITKIISEGKKRKAAIVWCNARENVVAFYKKQGFKILGERFFIENVCYHYLMYKQLD